MISTLVSILVIIVCILLVLIVLVQNSKGGGLASNFAGSNQVMGVRKTADFLEKATWTLAASLLFLSLLAGITSNSSREVTKKSAIEDQINSSDPNSSANRNFPTTAPKEEKKNK